jgi:uncharacterized protein YjdB
MRTITTNWNNSAYNSQTIFVDNASGNTVTIPANTPVNVRSMVDSVESGSYQYNPDAITRNPSTLSIDIGDTGTSTATVTLDSVGMSQFPVKAVSGTPAVATVSPALGRTLANGTVVFTVTGVSAGEATVTLTAGTRTTTVVVTVTDPEA